MIATATRTVFGLAVPFQLASTPIKRRERAGWCDGREYIEIVQRGAFAETLKSFPVIPVNISHKPGRVVGYVGDERGECYETPSGLHVRFRLNRSPDARLLLARLEGFERRALSIGFKDADYRWEYRDGKRHRLIYRAELAEIAVCVHPAYRGTFLRLDDGDVDDGY